MDFSEKLAALRRREGLTQEQLADWLGVTRQSVSKWEGGTAMPELSKLISLSEIFGVSMDVLVKEGLDMADGALNAELAGRDSSARLREQMDDLVRYFHGYSFDSRTRVFGIPLISIRFTRCRFGRGSVAKGILAIGNAAVGVIAIGAVSMGVFSFGALSVGVLAMGAGAVGLGAFGALAVGLVAFGSCAVGLYAGGVAAVGREIAVGVAALGKTAIGQEAAGENVLLWNNGLTRAQAESFLLARHPDLWRPLLKALSFLGAHIQS